MNRGNSVIIADTASVTGLVQTSGRGLRRQRTTARATFSGVCTKNLGA